MHIAAAGCFCVNVLAETQDMAAKSFAGMLGKDVDRFAAGTWIELATGAPALADAAAVFDCKTVETFEQFSHTIFIGEVVGVRGSPGRDPLLYGARRFRTLRQVMTPVQDGDIESLHF
jgi:flavin reductase (DIM6/NTAB) family NADH-FMN oxidoreductase RutF